MSLPKHKIISASKSILAHASVRRDTQRAEQHQKQVVNVNIQPSGTVKYPKPYEVDEGITVVPVTEQKEIPREVEQQVENPYSNVHELQNIVNSNENAVRALIMIIDIMQSNPLIVNKLIVAYAEPFKELIKVLTNADDVDIQYTDEVGCFTSSKYKLVEDIYVITDGEAMSLKYGFPDILRLFDRFKISTKMIAVD